MRMFAPLRGTSFFETENPLGELPMNHLTNHLLNCSTAQMLNFLLSPLHLSRVHYKFAPFYAKQTQSCPPFTRLWWAGGSKMNVTLAITRNYNNEQRTMNHEQRTMQNKPNLAGFGDPEKQFQKKPAYQAKVRYNAKLLVRLSEAEPSF